MSQICGFCRGLSAQQLGVFGALSLALSDDLPGGYRMD
jgi:hypothetical protein